MASEATANNATEAASIQRKLHRIPRYAPRAKSPDEEVKKLREKAAKEAARLLIANPKQRLQHLKLRLSENYGILFLKNSEILKHIPPSQSKMRHLLLKSPTRTLSGVSPVALMPPPAYCGGRCTYCPKGDNAPHAYTGYEPTTMRAIQNGYSASRQIAARLFQYDGQGHPTDKCHLIIMGGTFLYVDESSRHSFMKEAFDTLNGYASPSIKQSIDANETAPHRAIGVTYETRPDYGYEYHSDEMLLLGGTQVELGVQCLSDEVYEKVRRGHSVADVALSSAILRNAGFKLCYHMMPGLFCTPKQDISYFRRLFSGGSFQPDMLKIYPTLVVQGTVLYNQWKKGEFSPYDTEQAAEVIAQATRFIPPYVRVPRIQRDIPSPLISGGVKNSNLRQIVDEKLKEMGTSCRCIRCREIGNAERKKEKLEKLKLSLQRIDYSAGGGKEIFLSFEDEKQDLLAAFLRLRIPSQSHRKEIDSTAPSPEAYAYQSASAEKRVPPPILQSSNKTNSFTYKPYKRNKPSVVSSIVRELHVYGQEAAIGEHASSSMKMQHKGLGKKLLAEAERITKDELGLGKIAVISGPGVRGYYRTQGYFLDGPYMSKKI